MSTFRLVAIVEGKSDLRCLGFLVEAWRERIDWADGETFGLAGLDGFTYLDIHKVPALAQARKIPLLRSGAAGIVRNALLVVRHEQLAGLAVDGVILLSDTDGSRDEPMRGRAERDKMVLPFIVALGFPHECIEAWIIEGAQSNENDRSREIAAMGFDPFVHPERLSHKENVPKSAKDLKRRLGIDPSGEEAAMVRLLSLSETGLGDSADLTGGRVFVEELTRLLGALAGAR